MKDVSPEKIEEFKAKVASLAQSYGLEACVLSESKESTVLDQYSTAAVREAEKLDLNVIGIVYNDKTGVQLFSTCPHPVTSRDKILALSKVLTDFKDVMLKDHLGEK